MDFDSVNGNESAAADGGRHGSKAAKPFGLLAAQREADPKNVTGTDAASADATKPS